MRNPNVDRDVRFGKLGQKKKTGKNLTSRVRSRKSAVYLVAVDENGKFECACGKPAMCAYLRKMERLVVAMETES